MSIFFKLVIQNNTSFACIYILKNTFENEIDSVCYKYTLIGVK